MFGLMIAHTLRRGEEKFAVCPSVILVVLEFDSSKSLADGAGALISSEKTLSRCGHSFLKTHTTEEISLNNHTPVHAQTERHAPSWFRVYLCANL